MTITTATQHDGKEITDTERLDWMAENLAIVQRTFSDTYEIKWIDLAGKYHWMRPTHKDFRAAVDEAIREWREL